MRTCLKASTVSRALAVLLACSIAVPLPAQAPAAPAAPARIIIVILEGEGAINNVRERVTREAMVQVEDENHKPVAAAAVTFFLPGDGPSGVFSNGSRSITVLTDAEGKAAARGIKFNNVQGNLQIRVQVSYQGLTNNTVISQTNALGATAATGGAISGKLLAFILAAAAGGVVAGVVVANSGGGGGGGAPAAVSVVPGTPAVGPPR